MKKRQNPVTTIAATVIFGIVLLLSGCASNNTANGEGTSGLKDAGTTNGQNLNSDSNRYKIYEVYDFINDIAWVRGFDHKNRLYYGIIDTQKNLIVPLIYESVFAFGFHTRALTWAKLAETGKWGLIDTSGIERAGTVIVPFQYDQVRWIRKDGMTRVSRDGKSGLLDSNGNVRVPVEYEDVLDYQDGTAVVMRDGWWGIVDSDKNVIAPFKYAWVSFFSEGLARVVVADKTYRPFQYSAPEEVWLKGKFGFVDRKGKEVVPPKYDYAGHFANGIAIVKLDGQYGIIDTSGNILVPLEHDNTLSLVEAYRREILKQRLRQ